MEPPHPCLACHSFLSSSAVVEGWESLLSRESCSPFLWVIPALGVQDPAACLPFPEAHVWQRVLTRPETCQCTALGGCECMWEAGGDGFAPLRCGTGVLGEHLEGWVGWGGISDPPWECCKWQNFGIGLRMRM